MNRVFYVLLFLTISGFGVLWWLLNSLPPEEEAVNERTSTGLVIHEEPKKPETSALPSTTETQESAAHQIPETPKADLPSGNETPVEKSEKPKPVSSLFVESAPTGAMVYLDGVLKGKTPFTFQLLSTDKVLRIELPGYERQERTIDDQVRDAGALSRWKFDLKEQTPVAVTANFQKTDYRMTGARGPFFIQLKAVESSANTGWLIGVQSFREKLKNNNVYICEVDLPNKGRWTRFLAGPYTSKAEAQGALKSVQKSSGDGESFVVGEQTCLE